MTWFMAHWMDSLVVIMAVDLYLLKIFPDNPILNALGGILKSLQPK